jgi:hypothetical protein
MEKILNKTLTIAYWKIGLSVASLIFVTSFTTFSMVRKTEIREKKISITEACKNKADVFTSQAFNYLSSRSAMNEGTYFVRTECKDLYDNQLKALEERVLFTMQNDNYYKNQLDLARKELELTRALENRIITILNDRLKEPQK